MQIGAVTIEGVSDGSLRAPPKFMFNKSEQDWQRHLQFLDEEGMLPIQMGGFLVRSGDRLALVDTGIGPNADPDRTGWFMKNLNALGVRPSEITDVLLTHLHFDHLGWITDGECRLFDNATYRCHEADWEFFMGSSPFDDSLSVSLMGGRSSSELLPPIADRLEAWSGDGKFFQVWMCAAHQVTHLAARSLSFRLGSSERCSSEMSFTVRPSFSATTGR